MAACNCTGACKRPPYRCGGGTVTLMPAPPLSMDPPGPKGPTLLVQFWAPFRARVNVTVRPMIGERAESVAMRAVEDARRQYEARWTFPSYDRVKMVCVGLTDGTRTVNNKDVPEAAP